jgi:hypothetical protein
MEYSFGVKSSSIDEIYTVTFKFEGDLTSINCTCPAGENRMLCKHRLNLIAGDLNAIANEQDILAIKEVVNKIDKNKIAELYTELNQVEKEIKKLNLKQKKLRKEIGFKFSDGF